MVSIFCSVYWPLEFLFFKLLRSGGGAEGVVPGPAYPQIHLRIMFAENIGPGRSDHLSNGAVESDRLSSK